MNKIILSLISLLAIPSAMQAADVDTLTTLSGYTARTYTGRISCHDPSIFLDTISSTTGKFYVYGSHEGRGRTVNLSKTGTWANLSGYTLDYTKHVVTTVKDKDGNDATLGIFDGHAWQSSGTTVDGNEWAPDVIYNKTMKKWCLYMSLNSDSWCSSIMCFTSSSAEGPWTYQGPVVCSGFNGKTVHNGLEATKDYTYTDLQIALGQLNSLPARYNVSAWGSYWPNCIDPCVFYDDDDNLWMTYGSWSGGIFMLKLNPENGLRDYQYTYDYAINGTKTTSTSAQTNCSSDPYFGLKIAGGYYVSGEGSYVEKIGKYYFLFMSYGGLTANGGYQMRVFRSESPTGPYKDVAGNLARYTAYALNYGAGSKTNRGVLLMNGYQWDTMSNAEKAQGHNSAITDKKGRSFVVYHTRFNDGSEGHQVRVHQLFLNQDGWLVSMPYEFGGESVTQDDIDTKSLYTTDDIVGTYQLIRHLYCQADTCSAFQTPVNITLNADGTVTGAFTGTWTVPENTSYINLKLGNVVYKGVLEQQTIDYTSTTKALCIGAISSSSGTYSNTSTNTKGLEIWASKADAKAAICCTYKSYSIPLSSVSTTSVTKNLNLPNAGKLGATITWTSSNPEIITSSGLVVGDGEATLTMTISKDCYVYVKNYKVNVSSDIKTYYPEVGATDCSTAYMGAFSDAYTLAKGESANFRFTNNCKLGNTNNWMNWLLCCYNNTARSTKYFVLRADRWEDVAGSYDGCDADFDWSTFASDMAGAEVNMNISYSDAGTVAMKSTITTQSGKVYNYSFTYPKTLSLSEVVLYFSVNNAYLSAPEATAISVPAVEENIEPEIVKGIYDLNGKSYMTMPTHPGIYIVGGKKVVVK